MSANSEIGYAFNTSNLLDILEEQVIPHIKNLLNLNKHYEALEVVTNFLTLNDSQVSDPQIGEQCHFLKAWILEEKGDYQEALLVYDELASKATMQEPEFVYRHLNVVRVLSKINSLDKARERIEYIFSLGNNASLGILNLFGFYIDILEHNQQSFPLEYRPLLLSLAQKIGTDEDFSREIETTSDLFLVVRKLLQLNREANRRYSLLLIEVDKSFDESTQISLLKDYISKEAIGYYKNLALQELNEFKNV